MWSILRELEPHSFYRARADRFSIFTRGKPWPIGLKLGLRVVVIWMHISGILLIFCVIIAAHKGLQWLEEQIHSRAGLVGFKRWLMGSEKFTWVDTSLNRWLTNSHVTRSCAHRAKNRQSLVFTLFLFLIFEWVNPQPISTKFGLRIGITTIYFLKKIGNFHATAPAYRDLQNFLLALNRGPAAKRTRGPV